MSKETLNERLKKFHRNLMVKTAERFNAYRFDFHKVEILYGLPERILPMAKWMLHEINSHISYGRSDMPMTVGIETTSVCNRKCPYCTVPLTSFAQSRGTRTMSDEIFTRTIEDLQAFPRLGGGHGFNGALFLNVYGEPLLDRKIVERVRQAVEALPDAKVGLFSNGDYLTREILEQLIQAGVHEVVLTPHDGSFQPHIYELAKEYPSILRLKEPLKSFCNRGGQIEVDEKNLIFPRFRCISPSYAFHVASDGQIGMCFNDSLLTHPVGKVPDSPLLEVWNDPEYRELRRNLRHGRWDKLPPICEYCRVGKK